MKTTTLLLPFLFLALAGLSGCDSSSANKTSAVGVGTVPTVPGTGNGTGSGQAYTVTKYMGASARSLTNGMKVAAGTTGASKSFGGSSKVFAGPLARRVRADVRAGA